jgi:hypothetical protein
LGLVANEKADPTVVESAGGLRGVVRFGLVGSGLVGFGLVSSGHSSVVVLGEGIRVP